MHGLVLKSTGSWYEVETSKGIISCRLIGKFRTKGIKSTNPIAVGDHVEVSLEEDSTGVIQQIQNRKNYIIRKSVNLSKQVHIIASNIDIALLVISLKSPHTSLGFIDRFLVTAEAYDIPTTIVVNKIDLLTDDELGELFDLKCIYEDIGYPVIEASTKTGLGIKKIEAALKDKVCLLSGHSGVGKSTIINKIDPLLSLKTQEVSESHNKGQHTTTFAEMFALQMGGYIIDTPGIKGFGLVDMAKAEIQDYFPEILAIKENCKFNNCVHENEPGCAVKSAVENGDISEHRYYNYINLINDDDQPYRKDLYQ